MYRLFKIIFVHQQEAWMPKGSSILMRKEQPIFYYFHRFINRVVHTNSYKEFIFILLDIYIRYRENSEI